ncbi:anti-virulence regulator CigR family protein [Pseudomonas sp. LRF_L74]|uniref:anti-virulence regulator CigR family protein n=1 Tax=Pseudomonas sp. LRF_L74 TaxID=3369422 RepID=UPI003F5EC03D
MNTFNRLISAFSIATLFSVAVTAQAAPNDERTQANGQGHQQHQGQQGQGQGQQRQQAAPQQQRSQQQQKQPQQQAQQRGAPPSDFSAVHQQFHERRDQIGRGAALPPGVQIVKGHPLPKGYGKRLDARALQGLPRYDGYEWRRAGSDVVLVAVTSGIVTAILSGVLN